MNTARAVENDIREKVWQESLLLAEKQVEHRSRELVREQVRSRVADRVRSAVWAPVVAQISTDMGRLVWDQAAEEAP